MTHNTLQIGTFKLEVAERPDGTFISTLWCKDHSLEADRDVVEHETYSGALVAMYKQALAIACDYGGVETEER